MFGHGKLLAWGTVNTARRLAVLPVSPELKLPWVRLDLYHSTNTLLFGIITEDSTQQSCDCQTACLICAVKMA